MLACKQGFVVVTLNYRLGPFGFFNMKKNESMKVNEEYNPRGNWALRDQLVGIEFIQSNAHHFGGDRSKISLIGCGAGAQSIGFHLANPAIHDQIKNAILLSPNLGIPMHETSYSQSGRLTKALDCCGDKLDLQCLIQGHFNYTCLRAVSPSDIVHNAYSNFTYQNQPVPMPPYSALIEPFYPTFEPDYIEQRVIYGDPFTELINTRKLSTNLVLETSGGESLPYMRQLLDHYDLIKLSPDHYDLMLTWFFKYYCGLVSGKRIDECAYLKNQVVKQFPCDNDDCIQAATTFFQDLLWTCNHRQILNAISSNAYGFYHDLVQSDYECNGEYLLFSDDDNTAPDYRRQYIDVYAEFIRNGSISPMSSWATTRNWIHFSPDLAGFEQSKWNDDDETRIYQNCAFLDQLDVELGIYLQK